MSEVPSSSVRENVETSERLPRVDIGTLFKNNFEMLAGQDLPKLLNEYGEKYRQLFDDLKDEGKEKMVNGMSPAFRALAEQFKNNDDGIRGLVASASSDIAEVRQRILAAIDGQSLTKEGKIQLVNKMREAFQEAGIVDFSLINELIYRELTQKSQDLLAGYREPITDPEITQKIADGLSYHRGGKKTDRIKDSTPQEDTLKIYFNSIRLGSVTIDTELQRKIGRGDLKSSGDYARETFRGYQSFLASGSLGLDASKFCPDMGFYVKLCQLTGADNIQNAVGSARLEMQELYRDEIRKAAESQRPVAEINPDTRHLHGTFSQFVGVPIDLINSGMNKAASFVPKPGHLMGADVADVMHVGLKLYLATAAFLNLSSMGAGTFIHARNALGHLKNRDFKSIAKEGWGVLTDIKDAIPGPIGTSLLLGAWAGSRFTNPQETETWIRDMMSKAGTELQFRTGRDLLGDIADLGKDTANWFSKVIGPYWQKGKNGVMEMFNSGWGTISNLTSQQYQVVSRLVESEGYKMEELYPHFACQHELKKSLEEHFLKENIGTKDAGFNLENPEFNAFLSAYGKGLTDVTKPPPISYQDLVQAKIIKPESMTNLNGKKPFNVSPALAQKLRNQSDWLKDHASVFK